MCIVIGIYEDIVFNVLVVFVEYGILILLEVVVVMFKVDRKIFVLDFKLVYYDVF